jgi:Trk K+ transport system NAD-binding subunit
VIQEGAFRDHVVVFGFHGVGRRVVRQLASAGQDVVVVDPDADPTEQEDLQRWGVSYLAGYGHSQDTLHTACVTQARAVICVTEDDVRNIRLAMLVRDLSSDVRIVVRVANSSVGRAMHAVTQPGAVLDVAELASMSFVEVAVRRTTHAIELGGTSFYVATIENERDGTFATLWPDLAPIAIRRADGSPITSGPSPDLKVHPGDLVTLMGTEATFSEAGLTPAADTHIASGPSLRRRIREALGAASDAVDRPFRIAFAVLVVLAAISVAILTFGYREEDGTRMDVLDSVYFTAETIATVGFGDYDFRSQDTWLRVWAIFLILVGATLITVTTALLTNALVSRLLAQSMGRQRVTGMADHIVVVGLGRVGSKVATDLRAAGYEVAVIDGGEGERFLPMMRAAGIPVLFGDATLPETQAAAGIPRAAGVAVLTSDDLVNIETGLAVRGVVGDRPVPIALRVFSRNLARMIGRGLDAGIARSIAELASPWFVGAALGIEVLGTFYVGSALFVAVRMPVRPGGRLDGVTLRDLERSTGIVAVQRAGAGDLEYPTSGDTLLAAGDSAFLIGQYEDLLALLQRR